MMTFLEYQSAARRTQSPFLTRKARRDHALLGLAAESGEILGLYQKTYQGHRLDPDAVALELGDLLWFAAELADVLDISLDDVAARNLDKLRKRYPNGFTADKSINREADDK